MKIENKFRELLLSEGKKCKEDAAPSLAGILDKQLLYRNLKIFDPYFSKYLSGYGKVLRKYMNRSLNLKMVLESLWINYQGPNEFNPPHDHSGDLTFVIYLKVPEKLKEENKKFKGKSSGPGGIAFLYGEGDRLAVTHQGLFPKEGHMVIFPAWVKHFVYPYKSNCTRVSVSGNIFIKREEL
jgi:hypothetical protein